MHPVVSIVQLKSLPSGENLYHRFKFNHFPAVETENDIFDNQSYEIKKLLNKRIRKYNRIANIQYLMKWFEYGPEYNQWKNLSAFDNCLDLMEEYETLVLFGLILLVRRGKKRRNGLKQ